MQVKCTTCSHEYLVHRASYRYGIPPCPECGGIAKATKSSRKIIAARHTNNRIILSAKLKAIDENDE